MLLSQLMLTAFVLWWLIGQFNEEKNKLQKELFQKFTESKQQVMDSGLVSNFIEPLLKNKKGFKVHLETTDSTQNFKGIEEEDIEKQFKMPPTDSIILIDKSGNANGDKMISIKMQQRDSNHEVLLHGVKLFIKQITSDSVKESRMESNYFFNSDSLLLKKVFAAKLKKSGYAFQLKWLSRKIDTLPSNPSVFYFESQLFPKAYGVEISQFQVYLIQKIIPQILFSLVLLLLSASAFFLSYRNLKMQFRLNQIKNDFISNMSHELKTPVSTIKVAIEALQTKAVQENPAKVNEYLNMAELETERLDLLINKVLSTSLAEEGATIFQKEKINLVQSCKELIQLQQLRLEHAGATLIFESKVDPLYVWADNFHLQGVLLNLLDNSLKYAFDKPSLSLTLAENENFIVLKLSDKGPGIPEEFHTKVFEKFFRVPNGNRHNVKGYGLGLSYVAFVVKQHNGSIVVKNNIEGGCTFSIEFPKA